VEAALRQFESETALGRMAIEDEVAKTALFLASDDSSGITGQIFPIDAGLA
jgi:enoyl-[acyl-carrier-protein] reductase (NADH)